MEEIEFKWMATATVTEGMVEAVFCTFDTPDRYGDIVEAGAIQNGTPVVMVWHHRWSEPVGKGVVNTTKTQAIFKGSFFLDTIAGEEAHKTVKNVGDLQQWSFGFQTKKSTLEEIDGEWYRRIKELELFEVSPVLIGVGVNTHTVAVKGHGMPLQDQIVSVRDAVNDLMTRTKALAALRGEEQRRLGKETQTLLKELQNVLSTGAGDVDSLLVDNKALQAEFLKYQKTLAER